MRVLLLVALFATPAAAFDGSRLQWESYDALRRVAAGCRDHLLHPTGNHVPDPHREILHLLDGMLRVDPAICPGTRETGLAQLRARLGTPERGEVDAGLLALAWRAAEQGQGMAPDPALADRYGRMLWLFADDPPPLARWPEAERQAFLVRPATIRLLQARTGNPGISTRRTRDLLGETLLNRDLPEYDPAAAATLLETGARPLRASQTLTDGVHLPPDYPRAARLFLWLATTPVGVRDELRAELLRVGRLAAGAARTPVARAEALRILFAAGVHDPSLAAADRAGLLRAIGPAPTARLAPGDSDRIGRALDWHFAFDMPGAEYGGSPAGSSSAGLRGLIGPDGRMALVEIVRPSRSARSDRALLGVWARRTARVDLSATARGRFVWVALPPVDPGLTTSAAQDRWGEPELD